MHGPHEPQFGFFGNIGKPGADLGGGCRGCAPHPEMTCRFLIQLVFCQKKRTMWFIGVEVEQETRAPPPKKNPGSAPGNQSSADIPNVFLHCVVPSRIAVSKFPKIGYIILFVNVIISRCEFRLSLVGNLVAISELLYNHWSPCLDFSSYTTTGEISAI